MYYIDKVYVHGMVCLSINNKWAEIIYDEGTNTILPEDEVMTELVVESIEKVSQQLIVDMQAIHESNEH